MTDDTCPKIRLADPPMTMTNRVGRNGTVIAFVSVEQTRAPHRHILCGCDAVVLVGPRIQEYKSHEKSSCRCKCGHAESVVIRSGMVKDIINKMDRL